MPCDTAEKFKNHWKNKVIDLRIHSCTALNKYVLKAYLVSFIILGARNIEMKSKRRAYVGRDRLRKGASTERKGEKDERVLPVEWVSF